MPLADHAVDPYTLDRDGLTGLLSDLGEPRYRAEQVHGWLVRGVDDPQEMTNLPKSLRETLSERFAPTRPDLVAHRVADEGRTHKLLLRYPDGESIETVLMLYPRRATVCISTQAGCAMGCPFCATGQAGFRRQLTAGEVVRQVVLADAALRSGSIGGEVLPHDKRDHYPGHVTNVAGGAERSEHARRVTNVAGGAERSEHARRVTNVVFMGMGEPLANLPATLDTVRWLHDPQGFNLSARGITVSTVGLVPGIRRLAEVGLPMTLAVSLHAATDELRDYLVPVNQSHPLGELEEAVRDYRDRTNRRVTIEWCLIGDVNDDDRQATELARIARRLRAHVNVIPMNPTPGVQWREPSRERTRAFVDRVRAEGAKITLRDTRGRDADAACGQLLASYHLDAGKRLPAAVGAAERVEQLQHLHDLPQVGR